MFLVLLLHGRNGNFVSLWGYPFGMRRHGMLKLSLSSREELQQTTEEHKTLGWSIILRLPYYPSTRSQPQGPHALLPIHSQFTYLNTIKLNSPDDLFKLQLFLIQQIAIHFPVQIQFNVDAIKAQFHFYVNPKSITNSGRTSFKLTHSIHNTTFLILFWYRFFYYQSNLKLQASIQHKFKQ